MPALMRYSVTWFFVTGKKAILNITYFKLSLLSLKNIIKDLNFFMKDVINRVIYAKDKASTLNLNQRTSKPSSNSFTLNWNKNIDIST